MKKPNLTVIILAAGKGTRMDSNLPKVLHTVDNQPMILKVITTAHKISANPIITIVGYKSELVKDALKNQKTEFILQEEQNGTAHAVIQCKNRLKNFDGNVLILSGDVPFISLETLIFLVKNHIKSNSKATVLTCDIENPYGYGRIIKNKNNTLKKIIEHKDANKEELKETEINAGVYIFDASTLFKILPTINSNNKQKEYYLTDVINILLNSNEPVFIEKTINANEVI